MEINLSYLPDVDIDTRERIVTSLDVHKSPEINFQPREPHSPSLYALLESYGRFPDFSLVIGICNDGLPFMLSLDNPKPGSILIVGDDRSRANQLLKVITLSACLLNNPQNISICMITKNRNEFAGLRSTPHMIEMLSPYDRNGGEMIIELASIAEQRRSGRELGVKMMLIIDDLSTCENLISDYSVYLNLKSLVTIGPKVGIWPFISISSHAVENVNPQLLRSFGAYIFEKPAHNLPIGSSAERAMLPENTIHSDFDVIIGGRLIPITNLAI